MNLKFLKILAQASAWIYTPQSNPPDTWRTLYHDNEMGLLFNGSTCIYAFKGTDSYKSAVEDVKAFVDPEACIYENWYNLELYSDSITYADKVEYKVKCPTSDKYFTGHSLGGSIAVTTAYLYDMSIPTVTFGEPRTCCYYSNLLENHVRVINGNPKAHDPIPGFTVNKRVNTHCEFSKVLWTDSSSAPLDSTVDIPTDFEVRYIQKHSIKDYIDQLSNGGYINMVDE